ncbi:hypothetical protein PR003_g13462 [Phytophthora rubi]|uniref:Uncharacterized protein n=1 Tax=Phytophthora rubi TaxID=129364 RepID=A0A6A3M1D8_9STRA|nr:hypothetical protein PR002_g12907 [Phytophthora rubi]KAE9023735.1 hypothetical protein PR001_g12842 [Phytophthora rubi]KAE9334555.1 hypothetical protein PR003_g13462 [Phytophthora rubi]
MTLFCASSSLSHVSRRCVLNDQATKAEQDGEEVQAVRLLVHAANGEALAFYRALGFIEKARVEDYYRRFEPSTAFALEAGLEKQLTDQEIVISSARRVGHEVLEMNSEKMAEDEHKKAVAATYRSDKREKMAAGQ